MSAEDKSNQQNTQIIRDPTLAKNRIFVANLPTCTREELESICHPYGTVLGSLVQKNFGFVQFDSEELANKVASALTKSTFKGNVITVRNAGAKQAAQMAKKGQNINSGGNATVTGAHNLLVPGGSLNTNPDYNDCEIIVVDRRNTKYAEFIEDRLKRLKLRVDVLFPNEDVALGKVLANISLRGCLYAVLVTNQHEEHNSITVNILYGQPAEHRNMPVEDAIKLIAEDFHAKLARDALNKTDSIGSHLPMHMPMMPAANIPSLNERHPDGIQILLNLLADNLSLTVLQYDKIIKYLQERRELQLKVELGESNDKTGQPPDPEIELQKKILNILNKPSVAETHYNLMYPTLQEAKEDFRLIELLKDIRVQKALDNLMDSSLVSTVESLMKF